MTHTFRSQRVVQGAAGLAAAALVGLSSTAQAGPVESLISLAQHPTDGQVLALRYQDGSGGLLLTRDGGGSFQIHPSASFTEYGLQGNVPLLIAGDGTLLLGLTDGLARDDGEGCAIQVDPMLASWVTDLARHPTDPNVAFILTSGNRSDGSRTGLWKRDASGAISALSGDDTGTSTGTPSYGKTLFFSKSLRVLSRSQSTEQLRFVEVGSKNTYTSPTMAMRVPTFRYSDDLGATWTEHPITGAALGDDVALLAVTASEPMKAVVAILKTGADDPLDVVLLSTDSGASFSPYIQGIHSVGQALVTPDGRFYVADTGTNNLCDVSGLWSASEVGATPERIANDPVRCLGFDAARNALYLCKPSELGLFFPQQRAYCRLMELNDVAGFVACSGDDLGMDPKVDQQLCGAWCGPRHLASAPFCADTSCGVASHADDVAVGWIEPPGGTAPSCTGFVPSDAGVADAGGGIPGCTSDAGADADAAVDAGSDAGTGNVGADAGPSSDGGATPSGDAGVMDAGGGDASVSPTPDAGGPDGAAPFPDFSTTPAPEPDDGCDCSVRGGRTKPPDLAGFGVALWLLGRGFRARKRRERASGT